jgi:hypothetical protein
VSDEIDAPLPAVQSAIVDAATLDRLFADLEVYAEGLTIQAKVRSDGHASSAAPSLRETRALIDSSAALGVQLRYRLGSEAWCDTLMRTPEGVRLVRIAVPTR